MKRIYMAEILGGFVLCAACAGVPMPTEKLVNAQASLRAAEEVGADKVPEAELHAQLAKEQITRAERLMEEGDNAEAERVLQRAKADAELAVAMVRKADAAQQLAKSESALNKNGSTANTARARNP
jgi:hypothetical protein